MEDGRQVNRASLVDKVCFLSRWFNIWIIPLFNTGWKRTVVMQDVYGCAPSDDPHHLGSRLERNWETELRLQKDGKIRQPNVMRTILRTFGWQWLLYMQPTIWLEAISRLSQPFMIQQIVLYLSQDENTNPSEVVSYETAQLYAWALVLVTLIFSLLRHYAFLLCFTLGMNVRSALTVLIFKKIIRISKSSNKQTDAGQVLNVLALDLYRFDEVTKSTYGIIVGPVMSVFIMYITYRNMGPAFLGGLVILVLFVPFQGFMGRFFTKFRRKTTRITDKRVRLMSEILSAMKLIKVYCWEYPFANLVDQIRTNEIDSIRKTFTLRGINAAISYVCTKMMLFATLLIYTLMGNQLTPPLVFVTMSLYSSLNVPMLKNFSNAVGAGAEALVAARRDILMLDEKPVSDGDSRATESNKGSVRFHNFHGKWSKSLLRNTLSNITLTLDPGELMIVIGSVGAGKTCFLWSMLKEIERVSGSCCVIGTTSYAPQESWCFGGTVKQNILVGRPFEKDRYEETLISCCLDKDIERFPDGEDSFVGEKGYTLSGGQKARVTLARAVYSNADVYLLDDPLSAVDPKVAGLIFQRCIKRFLRGKTVILVTHQLQFLNQSDKILMLKEGEVCAFGTFDQLRESNDEFVSFLNQKEEEEKRRDSLVKERTPSVMRSKSVVSSISSSSSYEVEEMEEARVGNQGDRKETQTTGGVPIRLFWDYLTSGRQMFLLALTVLITATSQGLFHFSDLWLSAWTDKNVTVGRGDSTVNENLIHADEKYNITIYCVLMGSLFAGAFLRSSLTFQLCLNSSISLHDRVFKRVLRAPMLFFENTPLGRIMNRFTKDIGTVDQDVPLNIVEMNMNVIQVIGVIVMTVVVNPWLSIPCVILFGIAVFLRNYYIKTARDLQRLDSIARSPVYAHVSTTFDGLITIRSFKLEQQFERHFMDNMFDSISCRYMVIVAARLIGLIMDSLVAIYITLVVLLCVYLPKGTITAGDAGAILSSSILLTGIFQYSLKLTTDFETQMISVERVFEYGRLECEADWTTTLKKDDDSWPSKGEIIFDHVFLRYSPDLPHVLRDVTFTIPPGGKVGVVGRTGAGKSSLISVLFRLVEPEGVIMIDGVNTKSQGLHDLRGKISIIPQDPSFFSGTVRKNLDPFHQNPDCRIWEALEEANLSPAIRNMEGQLEAQVSEGGSNMSGGQRQLLCLARALLNRNRILVLDEATANVDQETDCQIQKAIKNKFSQCTVITIAHRLNTVIDMDMILVMDQGRVAEYDHPFLLLQNASGHFYSMVKETGHAFAKGLHDIARNSYLEKSNQFRDMKTD